MRKRKQSATKERNRKKKNTKTRTQQSDAQVSRGPASVGGRLVKAAGCEFIIECFSCCFLYKLKLNVNLEPYLYRASPPREREKKNTKPHWGWEASAAIPVL